jgi:hypothetical protein
MSKPHKWANEIKGWADGATIEYRIPTSTHETDRHWREAICPRWNDERFEFQIRSMPREFWLCNQNHTGKWTEIAVDKPCPHCIRVREIPGVKS